MAHEGEREPISLLLEQFRFAFSIKFSRSLATAKALNERGIKTATGKSVDRRPGYPRARAPCQPSITAGVTGIAQELIRRGVQSPRGETWHPTAVSRILNRPKAAA